MLTDEGRDPDDRGVRPVRGAEGIVDVGVAEVGERLGEGRIVAGLAGVKAEVLEENDLARAVVENELGHSVADDLIGEADLSLEELREPGCDRLQRVLAVELALGSAEVGGQDQARALFAEGGDGRQGSADPSVVSDGAVIVQGDVEVDPNKDATVVDVEFVDPRKPGSHSGEQYRRLRAKSTGTPPTKV